MKRKLCGFAIVMAISLTFGNLAFAVERVITYGEAVKLAVENNSSISNLLDNVKVMERTRSDLNQSINYLSYSNTTVPFSTSAEFVTALTTLDSMQMALDNVKYSKEMIEGGAEFAVLSSFVGIKEAEENLALVTKNCELARQNDIYNQLKFRLGMISQNELTTSKNDYEQMLASKTLLELGLENEYNDLSRLLGLSQETEYEIDLGAEFTPQAQVADMANHVSRDLNQNPYLKIMAGNVSHAEFSKNMYSTGEGVPYETKEYNLNSANREYADAKADLEKGIRETYNNILKLETMNDSLNAALETAKVNLTAAEANFAVGNINEFTLDQARLAVSKAEADIAQNTYSHMMLKYTFANSYLLAGSK